MRFTVKVLPTETYFAMVRKQLAETGQATVRVTGNSMRPLLHHLRDSVTIVPPENIRRGDIVLFDRRNGRYALHRVIRTGKNGFTMAGDNQWHMETNLPYDQVIGVVDSIVRDGQQIPCRNIFLKVFTFAVTALTFPRIYLRKVLVRLGRIIRRKAKTDPEGG